jgi:hypothetical protein
MAQRSRTRRRCAALDEAVRRVAACKEVGEGLPHELGQMVPALDGVGQESVELACDDVVQRCFDRPRAVAAWGL